MLTYTGAFWAHVQDFPPSMTGAHAHDSGLADSGGGRQCQVPAGVLSLSLHLWKIQTAKLKKINKGILP